MQVAATCREPLSKSSSILGDEVVSRGSKGNGNSAEVITTLAPGGQIYAKPQMD